MLLGIVDDVLGVPLPPLYIRGAGLQGRFPSRLRGRSPSQLQLHLLIYKEDRILSLHRWKLPVANSPDGVRLHSVGPTHPVRASTLCDSYGYPGVTSPTVAPERFKVEPQHIFVEVLGRVVAERLGFDLRFV